MARVWTTGFELGNLYDISTYSGAAINSTTPYAGQYFIRCTSGNWWNKNITAVSEFFFRGRFRDVTAYLGPNILQWYNGVTSLGYVKLNAIGKLEAYVGTTLVATSTATLTVNEWYLVEIHVKIADSGGAIDVKVDGVLDINYSGDTKPAELSTIDSLRGQGGAGQGAGDWDDIALNDTSGAVDNSWCGDGIVIALMPNAAGTYTDWTPLAGANYAAVDERPQDGDTTYIYDNVTNHKDSYNLAACGLTAATTTILRVWTELIAKATTTGMLLATFMRSAGHEHTGSDQAVGISYGRYVGADEFVEINGGAAWTPTDLDALEVGVVQRT